MNEYMISTKHSVTVEIKDAKLNLKNIKKCAYYCMTANTRKGYG